MLALGSETAVNSAGSLAEEPATSTGMSWMTSVRPAYLNGQLVAVKDIKKPYVVMTKSIIVEINQVQFSLLS